MPVCTKQSSDTKLVYPFNSFCSPSRRLDILTRVTENSHKTDYKAQTYTVSFFFLTVHPLLLF